MNMFVNRTRCLYTVFCLSFFVICFCMLASGCSGYVNKTSSEEVASERMREIANELNSYDSIKAFHDGRAAVLQNSLWGFIDATGKEVIPCKFEDVTNYHYQRVAVKKDDKWGYIDLKGNQIVPCIYDKVAEYFCEDMAWFVKDNKYGYIDFEGKIIVPNIYTSSYPDDYSEGLVWIPTDDDSECGGEYICLDKMGKQVFPKKYASFFCHYSNGLCAVILCQERIIEGKWYGGSSLLINKKGETVADLFNYKTMEPIISTGYFHEGMMQVNNKGFIDTSGNIVIPCIYDWVYDFSEGLAAVNKESKWGFVNRTGEVVIPFEYDDVGRGGIDEYLGDHNVFHDGLMKVKKNNKWGFITNEGKVAVSIDYEDVRLFSQNMSEVKKNGLWGFVDVNGKVVIPIQYEEVGRFSEEGLAPVKKDGKWGLIELYGNSTFDYSLTEEDNRYIEGNTSDGGDVNTTEKKDSYLNKKSGVSIKKEKARGDLGIFELRGPVKSFTFKNEWGEVERSFDQNGFWLTENKKKLEQIFKKDIIRNENGRFVKGVIDSDGNGVEYEYDEGGWVIKRYYHTSYSTEENTYSYDADGYLLTMRVVEGGMDASDPYTEEYNIQTTDKYGNWTKRITKIGTEQTIVTRSIEYYE